MELVWEQADEEIDATEVARISTFHLAKWVHRKYCAARRKERDMSVREEVPNVEFYLNIANKISETVAGARQKYNKPDDEVEVAETSSNNKILV